MHLYSWNEPSLACIYVLRLIEITQQNLFTNFLKSYVKWPHSKILTVRSGENILSQL